MLPPSINFWDVLGLAPISGPKNIKALTIYSSIEQNAHLVDNFMNDLSQCYDASKLGSFLRQPDPMDQSSNLIGWDKQEHPFISLVESFSSLCSAVGTALTSLVADPRVSKIGDQPSEAIAVFVIDSENTPSSLWHIASGFLSLFKAYRKSMPAKLRHRQADLVLQVVPYSLLLRHDGAVLPAAMPLLELCWEVYNRCPPVGSSDSSTDLPIHAAPVIELAEPPPRKIAFELSAEPPTNITQDNSQLHVGYTVSSSMKWVSAAYTDNTGRNQSIVTYSLHNRLFKEIASEMWATAISIMQGRRVNWRLCIARAGVMNLEEMEAWASLSGAPQSISLITVLLSVDTDPALDILPPLERAPSPFKLGTVHTPSGTPKLDVSPDPSASTPGGGATGTPSDSIAAEAAHDPDAHLVDIEDDVWGMILGHRMCVAMNREWFNYSLSSGLLVQLAHSHMSTAYSSSPAGKPSCVAVHLLWLRMPPKGGSGGSSGEGKAPGGGGSGSGNGDIWGGAFGMAKGTADSILREYLGHYRNLAELARVKGSDRRCNVPWHIGVVERVASGLDYVIGVF